MYQLIDFCNQLWLVILAWPMCCQRHCRFSTTTTMTINTGSSHMLQGVAGGRRRCQFFATNYDYSNTGSSRMLKGLAGGAAFFAASYNYSNTGSSCMLQGVAGGATNFLQPTKTSNIGLWLMILAQPIYCKVWPKALGGGKKLVMYYK